MAKRIKIEGNTISGSVEAITDAMDKVSELMEEKPVLITSAAIKESLCNYGYEILTGPGKGDKIPNRKGSSVVHDDMINAFTKMNVFLAIIDDAFTGESADMTLDEMEAADVVNNFRTIGFKVTGSDENEGVVLIGEKLVSLGAIGIETPKISSGQFTFFDELMEVVDAARNEVFLYMEGKTAPKTEQSEIPFPDSPTNDEDFENAKQ